jgi:hypothetical protein
VCSFICYECVGRKKGAVDFEEPHETPAQGRDRMADRRFGGISLGGILVIVGIVVALLWSLILGIIIAVIGLVAFGGFVRGKWY